MKTLEQKIAVMQAALEGKKIQFSHIDYTENFVILAANEIAWDWTLYDYNIYEEPKTKPSIDWSHVHPDFNYLAMDENGGTYLYKAIPFIEDGYWDSRSKCADITSHISFKPGTCDWKDSLAERPK